MEILEGGTNKYELIIESIKVSVDIRNTIRSFNPANGIFHDDPKVGNESVFRFFIICATWKGKQNTVKLFLKRLNPM